MVAGFQELSSSLSPKILDQPAYWDLFLSSLQSFLKVENWVTRRKILPTYLRQFSSTGTMRISCRTSRATFLRRMLQLVQTKRFKHFADGSLKVSHFGTKKTVKTTVVWQELFAHASSSPNYLKHQKLVTWRAFFVRGWSSGKVATTTTGRRKRYSFNFQCCSCLPRKDRVIRGTHNLFLR